MGVFGRLKSLYVQVLIAIALGILVGALWPAVGVGLKPLGDAFIKLIKLVIAPVIFCTVAGGIARMGDIKAFGRVGLKALIYFEVVSTVALVIGLIVGKVVQPGRGFNIDPATLDPKIAAGYLAKAQHGEGLVAYLLHLIPDTFFGAFSEGNLLQVLVIAVLTGFACTRMGDFGDTVADGLEALAKLFFGIIHVVVRFAPLGAFGAMGFTIGKYGIDALVQLGALVATFYLTALIFVLVVLGGVAAAAGFSILRLERWARYEGAVLGVALIALGLLVVIHQH